MAKKFDLLSEEIVVLTVKPYASLFGWEVFRFRGRLRCGKGEDIHFRRYGPGGYAEMEIARTRAEAMGLIPRKKEREPLRPPLVKVRAKIYAQTHRHILFAAGSNRRWVHEDEVRMGRVSMTGHADLIMTREKAMELCIRGHDVPVPDVVEPAPAGPENGD